MYAMHNMKSSFSITKTTWLTQIGFTVIFGALITIIILPFSFLVAIAAIDIPSDVTNFFDLGVFFIVSVTLLTLVSSTFGAMMLGVIQYFGFGKIEKKEITIEQAIKLPFTEGRFLPFVVLGLISSIFYGGIGYFWQYINDVMGINDNPTGFLFWFMTIFQIILLILAIPPFLIASLAIIADDARYDAFFKGWNRLVNEFSDVTTTHFFSILPTALLITLISFSGIGIDVLSRNASNEQMELVVILAMTLVIVVLSFLLAFFALPYYCNSNAMVFHDTEKVQQDITS